MADEPTKPEIKEEDVKPSLLDNYRDYVFPTISFLVLGLVIFLVAIPTGSDIFAKFAVIEEKQDEVEALERYIKDLKIFSNDDEELLANVDIMSTYLPSESRVSTFTDEVNELATSSGLDRSLLSGKESVNNDDDYNEEGSETAKRVLVNFSFSGDIDELFSFFDGINNYGKLLSIRSVEFNQTGNKWAIQVVVASYNLPQETLESIVQEVVSEDGVKPIGVYDEDFLSRVKGSVAVVSE